MLFLSSFYFIMVNGTGGYPYLVWHRIHVLLTRVNDWHTHTGDIHPQDLPLAQKIKEYLGLGDAKFFGDRRKESD